MFPRRVFPMVFLAVKHMGSALQIIGLENKDATGTAFANLSEMVGGTSQQIFDAGLHEYLESLLEKMSLVHGALAEEFFQ